MSINLGPLLDELESDEDALLSWGVVEGGFSHEELLSKLNSWLLKNDPIADAEDLLQDLKRSGLLYRDDSVSPERWRTRSAESIRLMRRLRQVFLPRSQEARSNAWRNSPTLVADFRYIRRPRAYPRRDIASSEVIAQLSSLDPLQRDALSVLTSLQGRPLNLAGFQARALHQVLSDVQSGRSRGVVVGAGTGTGKTLGFYLPAFAHLVRLHDAQSWARVIAIYPRNELLRDQLAGAFAQARRLDSLMRQAFGRPIKIGAYLGQTPRSSNSVERGFSRWPKAAGGHRCPYLVCPGAAGFEDCGGDLVWPDADRTRGVERLVCTLCGTVFTDEMVALTRNRMVGSPPDLVFATTEMLNRSLSDNRMGRVFGIGMNRRPSLMLLDEAHIYSGSTGAQTAMVLRRWRNRINRPVCFVGLSATLRDATSFFADLVGLAADAITEIEPRPAEMEYEGTEYMLALKSDPTSGASVLSTTIQSSMLAARTLDSKARLSGGLYGRRMFVFTDDLDVTNRLYYDLLDAEGQRLDGRGNARPYRDSLASLREPALGSTRGRRTAGQSWDLPEIIGNSLSPGERLTVGRTSSQDIGVDREAQVVVATASLEVGFDDPDVGAILQHKAPRAAAQFVQRRGRAGRPRGMRPWSIVVLSDYGRDREAYQAWDALFDPVLPARGLPVRNRHILRMHATQSVLDWISERLSAELPDLAMWRDISGPVEEDRFAAANRARQTRVAAELDRLLSEPLLQAELAKWLARMLQLSPSEVDELLWYPPRAVLLTAVPTLLRRLKSGWAVAEEGGLFTGRDRAGSTPLPDYFPSNLFSELTLPEVVVRTPAQQASDEDGDVHSMDIAQALREFAPGRVSRRFITRSSTQRHWLSPTQDQGSDHDVGALFPLNDLIATGTFVVDGNIQTLDLIRPFELHVEVVPQDVRDSSNAFLRWTSEFLERGDGLDVGFPADDPLGRFVRRARVYLHADQSPVEVRRGAYQVDGTLILEDGRENRTTKRFARSDGTPVAVGAIFDVDGVRFDVELPDLSDTPDLFTPGLKSAWFQYVFVSDEVLGKFANEFRLQWVHDILLITLVRKAVTENVSLKDAFESANKNILAELEESLEILFQRVGLVIEDEDVTTGPARLRKALSELFTDESLIARIRELAPELWQPSHADATEWLRRRLLVTLGEAALAAARVSSPEHDPEGLLLDVEPGAGPDGQRTGQVWLTESTIGGGGFLEALSRRIRRDPRWFLQLMRRMLRPTDAEIIDESLFKFLASAREPALQTAIERYRSAPTQKARVDALASLRIVLREVGIQDDHPVVSAVANRFLRPGSSAALEDVVKSVVEDWKSAEERLGVEIDARTWAYLASARSDLEGSLPGVSSGDARQRKVDVLQSVLWPRGWQARSAVFRTYNPFDQRPDAAPDTLRSLLRDETARVTLGVENALDQIRDHLSRSGAVVVSIPAGLESVASAMLVELVTDPIQLDFLQVHPRVVEVERTSNSTEVRLDLLEVS